MFGLKPYNYESFTNHELLRHALEGDLVMLLRPGQISIFAAAATARSGSGVL